MVIAFDQAGRAYPTGWEITPWCESLAWIEFKEGCHRRRSTARHVGENTL